MGKPKPAAEESVPLSEEPAAQGAVPPVESPSTPATLEADGLSSEEIQRVLQERARALARVPEVEEKGEVAQVVAFSLGQETYAVETAFVGEIHPLVEITPVPCTPEFVVGVVNLRGRILSVVDLQCFLGLAPVAREDSAQIITVHATDLEVGLLVSQVHSVRTLLLDDLEPTLPTATRIAAEYTRGVTPDMLVLLDLEALMNDDRMTVWEEVA